YDVLVMATGSRAAVLKDLPQMAGLFTMRNKRDADAFAAHVDPAKGKVVIIGGGLLGIQLAAALQDIGVGSCILQRSSRLMDRQLDALGCQLLYEELVEKGIDVLFNDEVERFLGNGRVSGVRLRSGGEIACQAVVMAIGTTPNIELAKAGGLACKRGVLVDEYLRSSDPTIFAIGEIAEYRGKLYGITAAAEQQAETVARYLSGDISQPYAGSVPM